MRVVRKIMEYVAGAVALYALFIAILFFMQRSLLYHPDQTAPDPAAYGVPEMSPVRLDTEDGFQLLGWWRAPRDSGQPVLVYLHGNAGHIGDRAHKVRGYLDAGYGVLLVSYRYNAGIGGSPSEEALFADARAGLAFVAREGLAEDRIVLYGESLGSGPAVAMAATQRIGALVLEAPYTSMVDLARHHYWYAPARWLVRDRLNSISRIGKIAAPLIVIHGESDRVIPVKFGRRLFDAAPETKEAHFLPGAAHNNLIDFGMAPLVIDFLERNLK